MQLSPAMSFTTPDRPRDELTESLGQLRRHEARAAAWRS
jgi:hypothetical protein